MPEIDAISPAAGRAFESLAKSVRDSINNNEPETGLDRLHTFVVKYVRTLCQQHGIAVERDKPLHSMFGEYVKELLGEGRLESEMTERILKSSISTLEAFVTIVASLMTMKFSTIMRANSFLTMSRP